MISYLRKLEILKAELENKVVMLSTENERKDNLIRNKNEEIESLRQKNFKLEQEVSQIPHLND